MCSVARARIGALNVQGRRDLRGNALLVARGVFADGDAVARGVADDLVVDVGDVHDVADGVSALAQRSGAGCRRQGRCGSCRCGRSRRRWARRRTCEAGEVDADDLVVVPAHAELDGEGDGDGGAHGAKDLAISGRSRSRPEPPLQETTRLAGQPRLRSTRSKPVSSTMRAASARVSGLEPKSCAEMGCSSS
jgi:hypothetical protein